MSWNPREWCESDRELAAEVLDHEERADYERQAAERARLRSLARQHRNERMRAVDPWADDYRGPTTGGAA